MTDFNPGPGWREVPEHESPEVGTEFVQSGRWPDGAIWVREEPVPPLPTEPYTVIRPHWRVEAFQTKAGDLNLREDGLWRGDSGLHIASQVAKSIIGFEVLSEPRAVTAKAVLDRIASEPWAREVDLSTWRREFGVDQ